MPEGHTLHRLARELTVEFGGTEVASTSPQGRFEAGAARVDGRVLEYAEAYGKHVFVHFLGIEDVVHVHLGLYGTFVFGRDDERTVAGALRWRIATPRVYADLRGPAACGLMEAPEKAAVLDRLGPDPLREDADPDAGWARIRGSRTPIAALLMDQLVLAGVGNVYRAEVLFRSRIDPYLEGRLLKRAEWRAMWTDLVEMMHEGVVTGRIDTVHTEHEPAAMGRLPRKDDHGGEVYVYRRNGQSCHVCGTNVRTETLAGRNLFWCPRCQRRSRRRVRAT